MFILFLVRLGFLGGHLLGKSCSLGRSYVLFVFLLFVILVISRFGFDGWIWVLIASVPGLCIRFTFNLSFLFTLIRVHAFAFISTK